MTANQHWPVDPVFIIQGKNSIGPFVLKRVDQSLQPGDRPGDETISSEGLQGCPVLLIVCGDEVVDADGGVAVSHVKSTAWSKHVNKPTMKNMSSPPTEGNTSSFSLENVRLYRHLPDSLASEFWVCCLWPLREWRMSLRPSSWFSFLYYPHQAGLSHLTANELGKSKPLRIQLTGSHEWDNTA